MDQTYMLAFDVAGLALIVSLLIIHTSAYRIKSTSNLIYRLFLWISFAHGVMDIVTSLTIRHSENVNDNLNMLLNIVFQVLAFLTAYLGKAYISSCIDWHTRIGDIIDITILVIYLVVLLINSFTGIMFVFEDHEYIRGPLFLFPYFITLLYLLHGGIILFSQRRRFKFYQWIMNLAYVVVPILFGIVQLFNQQILLTFFSGTLSALFMLFSLETADYRKYMDTIEQLERARDAEINANKAKSEFLARMSHEIRTPINGILGMNSIIMKESKDASILDYSENIDSAGKSLLALINDILDLSKIESGKMELVIADYKLATVVSDTYHMVAMRANDKALSFNVEVNPNLPSVLSGDEVRVRQIIANLLNNAVKYTKEGSVRLLVDGEASASDGSTVNLKIAVEDSGVGIKAEDKERIFESFTRLDQVKNRYEEGSGLGLKIVSHFVNQMGGTIDVESEYGEGSTFTVTIPQKIVDNNPIGEFRVSNAGERSQKKDRTRPFTAPDARILVVDDIALNLKVVCGYLKNTKIKIDTVNNGELCLTRIYDNKYDVIYLDHMMPEMSGLECFDRLKSADDHLNVDTPIIIMTANAIVGAREQYLDLGFDDYISKPLGAEDMYHSLIKFLPKEKVFFEEEKEDKSKETDARAEEDTPYAWFERLDFLDTAKALSECLGDKDMYLEILKTYVLENRMEDLQKNFGMENWKDYAIIVHGLKSSSRTIGATELGELAYTLEIAAKEEDLDTLRGNHGRLMMTYGRLMERIAAALRMRG